MLNAVRQIFARYFLTAFSEQFSRALAINAPVLHFYRQTLEGRVQRQYIWQHPEMRNATSGSLHTILLHTTSAVYKFGSMCPSSATRPQAAAFPDSAHQAKTEPRGEPR